MVECIIWFGEEMIEIKSRGGLGYGDIIIGMNWAHRIAYSTGEKVTLNYLWQFDDKWKYNIESDEYLWQQAEYLNSIFSQGYSYEVNIKHTFNDLSRMKFDRYNDDLIKDWSQHMLWQTKGNFRNMPDKDLIVINDPLSNKESFETFFDGDRLWKISGDWNVILKMLYQKYPHKEIVRINYKTPIRRVVDLLSRCEVFIGHHSGLSWIAHNLSARGILFTRKHDLTKLTFPGFHLVDSGFELDTIENLEASILKSDQIRKDYQPFFEISMNMPEHIINKGLSWNRYGWHKL